MAGLLEEFVSQISSDLEGSLGKMEEAILKGRKERGIKSDKPEDISEDDMEALLSDMMSSLLSRDLLYEPLRDLTGMVSVESGRGLRDVYCEHADWLVSPSQPLLCSITITSINTNRR